MFNVVLINFLQKKHPITCFFYLFITSLFLMSCSGTIQQYSKGTSKANPDRTMYDVPPPLTEPSYLDGGLSVYQNPELSEGEKDVQTRKNSLAPIDYQSGSAGNINIQTTYEESLDILHLSNINGVYYFYEENLVVAWREDAPRVPNVIIVLNGYQESMDFGSWMGANQRYKKMGQSFADYFSLGVEDVQKDEKTIFFITSLYKYLENTDEDCLESRKCQLSINPQGNYIVFQLPKMTFLFGNDERRKLVQIAITNNDESGCFGSPFDLLGAKFFCGVSEEGFLQTLNLGDSYKEALQKSGIKADLPITYGNDFFIQLTNTTGIGWKRDNYEEKPENIPEDSYLALVTMRNNYTVPFLLDHSLIKVNLKDNNTVHLIKDPIDPEKNMMEDIEQKLMVVRCQEDIKGIKQELADVQSQEDIKGIKQRLADVRCQEDIKQKLMVVRCQEDIKQKLMDVRCQEDIKQKLMDVQSQEEDFFYFSTSMPQIKSNYILQKNLIKSLLDLLEENYRSFYFDEVKELKIYKRVYGEYNDKYALKAIGLLVVDFQTGSPPWLFSIGIDDPSGNANINVVMVSNDFEKYMIKNQKSIELGQDLTEITGFALGDKIYLRDKKIGAAITIVSYLTQDNQNLTALAGYDYQLEMPVVYESGRDKNISFQTGEGISLRGLEFVINPTFSEKEIEGKRYDEYEINGIAVAGNAFFEKIDNLCFIEAFQLEMGMYDRLFTQSLSQKVKEDTGSCYYISPQDGLFSGLKRTYFFPDHKLILGFADRELYTLRIYKKPSVYENKGSLQ